ncbi:MAG: PAS domain-containing sensor histidine kinase [Gemmatimonadaceae bacterium]
MKEPDKNPLPARGAEQRESEVPTPITPIGKSRLSDAIKHGGRIYQLMVESVRDYAIFMLDPNGHIASWNRGAERIKGYKAGEIIGQHFSVFYPQRDIDSGKPPYELLMAEKNGTFEDEGIRLKNDGTPFWASVIITAVRDQDGTLLGFAKVTRDLTERRANEQRAIEDARRVAEAEAANSAKGEFLTAMSHELRTPLNAIGGYTDLLSLGLAGPISPEQSDFLERIKKSQQHLMSIISDLLNFSRIEAGHLNYNIVPVPLSQVVDMVFPMTQAQSAAKGVHLERGNPGVDAVVLGDASKVGQILLNLLSNAIKFTNPGGRVRIEIASSATSGSISVIDTGSGIPVAKQESIFEPFVQLGRSLTSAHEGTGLGLAISRELAQAMGGSLTLVSAEGVGSTFMLSFPLKT